jgi:S1-C subfamily serine protease
VESVSEGAAAQKGGIKAQDIITEVGSYKVTSVSDLTRVLRKFEAGETVTVKVYRGGQNVSCLVTLDEKPREEQTAVQEQPQTTPTIPQGGSFEEWFNIFRDYMG